MHLLGHCEICFYNISTGVYNHTIHLWYTPFFQHNKNIIY